MEVKLTSHSTHSQFRMQGGSLQSSCCSQVFYPFPSHQSAVQWNQNTGQLTGGLLYSVSTLTRLTYTMHMDSVPTLSVCHTKFVSLILIMVWTVEEACGAKWGDRISEMQAEDEANKVSRHMSLLKKRLEEKQVEIKKKEQ